MKNRKIPMRSCIVTWEKLPKQELLRIVRTTDNTVVADVSGKINGRGAYIKKDIEVLNKAIKSKVLKDNQKLLYLILCMKKLEK